VALELQIWASRARTGDVRAFVELTKRFQHFAFGAALEWRPISNRRWTGWMRRIAALALCLSLSSLRLEAAAADCGAPADMADGWSVSSPSEQGLDPTLICAIGTRLKDLSGAAPNGVVIVRHGVIVYEQYFTGADQRWPEQSWGEPLPILPHDAKTKHDIQSATKSVTALLTGIAVDRGLLKSRDAAALDFFPEYADLRSPERDRISVEDLLTMRAGLRWIYHPYLSFWRQIEAAPNPYRLILEQPMTATPGTEFRYNNGSTELIGAIIQRATHQKLDEFAKEALFDPLGVTDWEWGRMGNGDPGASWDFGCDRGISPRLDNWSSIMASGAGGRSSRRRGSRT
jgi:CubicO group peptidase (beta-lactamase class C family)